MRVELRDALRAGAEVLAEPGMWWTGEGRLKLARETRAVPGCRLCVRRKAALSPGNVEGAHDIATDLPASAIEANHRIVSDPGRLSQRGYQRITGADLSDEAYVELLSVVAITTALDTFDRAFGATVREFPEP